MKNFLLLVALIFSFTFYADVAAADETSEVICKIVDYAHSIGGPIMTVVIIGAALLAIFGRMPWPALIALGVFCGVFFGASKIVSTISPSTAESCDRAGTGTETPQQKCIKAGKTWDATTKTCK